MSYGGNDIKTKKTWEKKLDVCYSSTEADSFSDNSEVNPISNFIWVEDSIHC